MEVFRLEPGISLIDVAPPISGFEGFLGVYVIQAEKVALIDVGPASSLENLISALAELKINPEDVDYILATHIHLDHTGGIGGAMKRMPNAMGIVHEKGKYHLTNPSKLWENSLKILGKIAQGYGEPEPVSEDRLIEAREGMVIDLGGIRLETLLTPGHASHNLSFIDRQKGKLFHGEAAGVYFPRSGIFRPASPPPFDLRQAFASANKLIATQPREIYYHHFGYSPDAVIQIKKYQEQLIFWSKIVARHPDDDAEKILDEILTLDKTKEQVYRLPPKRLQTELYFMKNNILGFRDYFKREGMGVLGEMSLL
jgi:glyoxylase-like metal-dependent hydrolase (beta-lactamase superfamily II)